MDERPWTFEHHAESGSAIGYRIDSLLHSEQTPYQRIEIWQSTDFGRIMALDGCWMLTGRENFIYHEMMAHPALFTHAAPKQVAVIGGGDCGTLREVLRHVDVERAVQIEIDERVTRLAQEYFPELCEANDDPRADLRFEDGIAWMEDSGPEQLDVLIVDSTDPVGFAEGLFDVPFFRTCFRALRPGGILVQQSESPLLHVELLKSLRRRLPEAGFEDVQHLLFPQPCYPSGWWSCTLARKQGDLASFREEDSTRCGFETRYYSADIHRAAKVLPAYLERALKGGT